MREEFVETALLGDGEAGGLSMDDDPDTGDFF